MKKIQPWHLRQPKTIIYKRCEVDDFCYNVAVESLCDVLFSFSTYEDGIKNLGWLLKALEKSHDPIYFIGSKERAEEIGIPEEWSDEHGGFWALAKRPEWILLGPGDLEEALYFILQDLYNYKLEE